ncbi:MAG TPA: hypothetical protein VH085_03905, partial [Nocardioides sp.]|nr:hypothetical protein [Nocardioides sp.]
LLFRFDEPVHGISASNVAVRDPQQATVAGTWSCRGASGSPVSCLRGAVTKATFSPTTPATFEPWEVDWEPSGHLDVLDAAGNPAFDYRMALDDD